MEMSVRSKIFFWLFYSSFQCLHVTGLSTVRTTSTFCSNQTTEFTAHTTIDEDAPPDSIIYDLIVPAASGLLYDPDMSSKSQYFKIVSDDSFYNSVEIRVKSFLYPGLNETINVYFTTPYITCGPAILHTVLILVEPAIPTIPVNVDVYACDPGTLIDVLNLTCNNYLPTCQPFSCHAPCHSVFWVSEGTRIQTKAGMFKYSYKYDLRVECDEVENINWCLPFNLELNFEVTFHNLCGFINKTIQPTTETEPTASSLISNPTVLDTSVKPSFTESTGQSKTEIIDPTTKSSFTANGTGCSGTGYCVDSVVVATICFVSVIVIILFSTASYFLGYKRCLALHLQRG